MAKNQDLCSRRVLDRNNPIKAPQSTAIHDAPATTLPANEIVDTLNAAVNAAAQ